MGVELLHRQCGPRVSSARIAVSSFPDANLTIMSA